MRDVLHRLNQRYRSVIGVFNRTDKETVVSLSLILYVVGYVVIGIGGLSFSSQPAAAYVSYTGNSNCVAGALWVEGDSLRWCADGSTEAWWSYDSGEDGGAVGSPGSSYAGAIWIEGYELHFVDEGGTEWLITDNHQIDTDLPSSAGRALWIGCDGFLRYVDDVYGTNERRICASGEDCHSDFSSYC